MTFPERRSNNSTYERIVLLSRPTRDENRSAFNHRQYERRFCIDRKVMRIFKCLPELYTDAFRNYDLHDVRSWAKPVSPRYFARTLEIVIYRNSFGPFPLKRGISESPALGPKAREILKRWSAVADDAEKFAHYANLHVTETKFHA
jgi:hypothetical protein